MVRKQQFIGKKVPFEDIYAKSKDLISPIVFFDRYYIGILKISIL